MGFFFFLIEISFYSFYLLTNTLGTLFNNPLKKVCMGKDKNN